METAIKSTPLTTIHEQLGAKMLPFAGYKMPITYEGVNAEHETVRKAVGIFDVSHMGEFLLMGPNALDLIQKVTTNDASTLSIGQAQYSCIPNDKGGIIDDLLVYRIKEDQYLLVVNASNIEKDWNWISNQNDMGVTMKNLSDDYALLAIQGPKAIQAMQSLTTVNLSKIEYYHFEVGDFAGCDYVIISATGYTGAGGFEIYCKNSEVEKIWNSVLNAGKEFGIKPIGLAARDTLRLEMGFRLYGNDINETTSPIEAGLGWITKFSKQFINYEQLKNQKEKGTDRKFIGFEMIEKGIPRHDYEIVDKNGTIIGQVTSGTMSPSMNKGIGMGYVNSEKSTLDTEIYIRIRKNDVLAKVVKIPFFNNKL
jgi:aminomethyltransferase